MKKILLTLVLGLSTVAVMAQAGNSEITAVKPADASPVTFATQADLDAKAPGKIEKLKKMIREHDGDERTLQALREELWRFENAIVVAPKK